MASTTKTTKLNLSQFAGTDIPDWITDYSGDMKKIDDQFVEEERNALASMEEVMAATEPTMKVGAGAIQEMNDSLNDVSGLYYSTDIGNFSSDLVNITTAQLTSTGRMKQLVMSFTPTSDIPSWTTFVNIINENLIPHSTTYGYVFHSNVLDGFVQIHATQGIKTSGMTLKANVNYIIVITYIGRTIIK